MKKLAAVAALAVMLFSSGCSNADTGKSTVESSGNEPPAVGISYDKRFNLTYEEDDFIIRASDEWEFFSQEGADCSFQYVPDKKITEDDTVSTVVGIQRLNSGGLALKDYAETMRKAYDSIYTITEEGEQQISIYDGYYFKLRYPEDGLDDIFLMQEFIVEGEDAFIFNVTCLKSDIDKILPEVNDLFNTFEIK